MGPLISFYYVSRKPEHIYLEKQRDNSKKNVARHGSGSAFHGQSPSQATYTASGIERHTSASVSKSAQAQSESSGGQFSIQYQQVLS